MEADYINLRLEREQALALLGVITLIVPRMDERAPEYRHLRQVEKTIRDRLAELEDHPANP